MVSDTVNHAMDCVSAGIKNGGWYRDPKTGQPLYGDKKNTGSRSGAENQRYRPNQGPKMSEMRNYSQNHPVPVTPRYLKGTSVKIGGTFLAATGAVFGLTSVIFLIITAKDIKATAKIPMIRPLTTSNAVIKLPIKVMIRKLLLRQDEMSERF